MTLFLLISAIILIACVMEVNYLLVLACLHFIFYWSWYALRL